MIKKFGEQTLCQNKRVSLSKIKIKITDGKHIWIHAFKSSKPFSLKAWM
jgi:hypothetical protein